MAQRKRERVGGIGRRFGRKVQRVPHDVGDLLLLRAPMPHDGRLDAGGLDLHNLTSPAAERCKQGPSGLGEGEGGLGKTRDEHGLDDYDVGRQTSEEFLQLFGE